MGGQEHLHISVNFLVKGDRGYRGHSMGLPREFNVVRVQDYWGAAVGFRLHCPYVLRVQ